MEASRKSLRRKLMRAAVTAAVFLAGMVVASVGDIRGTATEIVIGVAGAVVALFSGVGAVRMTATGVKARMQDESQARAALAAFSIQAIGYVVVVISVLGVLDIAIGGLILGGALTGVILGLAAQQVLANFFAGIVLALVRPYTVGEQVVLRSGALGGQYEGTVTDMGLFYVELVTATGPVSLPNSGVLAAAVGPGLREEEAPPGA